MLWCIPAARPVTLRMCSRQSCGDLRCRLSHTQLCLKVSWCVCSMIDDCITLTCQVCSRPLAPPHATRVRQLSCQNPSADRHCAIWCQPDTPSTASKQSHATDTCRHTTQRQGASATTTGRYWQHTAQDTCNCAPAPDACKHWWQSWWHGKTQSSRQDR